MFVYWAGRPADLREIHAIANKHGIPVVEDVAHALGAVYDGVKIGRTAILCVFHFKLLNILAPRTVEQLPANALKIRSGLGGCWFGLDRSRKDTQRWSQDIPEGGISIT